MNIKKFKAIAFSDEGKMIIDENQKLSSINKDDYDYVLYYPAFKILR
jgi:hypothetical protein